MANPVQLGYNPDRDMREDARVRHERLTLAIGTAWVHGFRTAAGEREEVRQGYLGSIQAPRIYNNNQVEVERGMNRALEQAPQRIYNNN